MCDPASAGMMAAGSMASYAGKRRADKAMTSARAAERMRQQGFQAEAQGVWDGALPQIGAGAAQGDMAASQGQRAATEAALAGPAIELPMLSTGNRVIEGAMAGEDAKYGGRAAATGAARRELDSFGDALLTQNLVRQRAGETIGTIGGLRRGSASVLPYELQAGANRGAGLQMLGSTLTSLGTLGAFQAGAAGTVPWWEQLKGLGGTAPMSGAPTMGLLSVPSATRIG